MRHGEGEAVPAQAVGEVIVRLSTHRITLERGTQEQRGKVLALPTQGRAGPVSSSAALQAQLVKAPAPDHDVQILGLLAYDAKADDYLLMRDSALLQSVQQLCAAQRAPREVGCQVVARTPAAATRRRGPLPRPEDISERELQVLHQVVVGSCNKQIARDLGISVNTAKIHLRNIFSKLGVSSRTEAVTQALKLGLISLR